MMNSLDWYKGKIEKYSYAELLGEQKRLFKLILELEFKISLEDCCLNDNFINPDYKVQLSYNREYLIVLQDIIRQKEIEKHQQEFEEMLKTH